MSVDNLITKANKEAKAGNILKSYSMLEDFLKKFPENKRAKKQLKRISRSILDQNKRVMKSEYDFYSKLQNLINKNAYEKAENLLHDFLNVHPLDFDAWLILSYIYRQQSQFSMALQCCERALNISHKQPELYVEIGTNFWEIDDVANAFKNYKLALQLDPNHSPAHLELGRLYSSLKKYDISEKYFLDAVDSDPTNGEALFMLGLIKNEIDGDPETAIKYYKQAQVYLPLDTGLINSMAVSFIDASQPEEAYQIFNEYLDQATLNEKGDFKNVVKFNKSLAALAIGDLDTAWKLWSVRKNIPNTIHSLEVLSPLPQIENVNDLNNKAVLIAQEQGVGDQVHYMGSILSFIGDRECDVIIEADERLVSLLQRSFSKFQVVSTGEFKESEIDAWIPVGDLPALQSFKADSKLAAPYIISNEQLKTKWTNQLPSDKVNIGFCWRSGLVKGKRKLGYTELNQWESILEMESINLISLQYDDISSDLAGLSDPSFRQKLYVPEFNMRDDFENLAALISSCDLVIGPATFPINLSAAIGTETLMYTGKANRHSLGLSQTNETYVSPWYKNCVHINFNNSKTDNLKSFVKVKIASSVRSKQFKY